MLRVISRRILLPTFLALALSTAVWLEPAITTGGQASLSQLREATPTIVSPTATPPPRPVVPRPRLSAATTVLAYPPPPIQARAAYLVNMDTGRVLFAQHADERLAMASTTKIVTGILAIEHSRLTDLVRVSNRAATIGESTMALHRGERLPVRQLLYGLLLNSGNDAAVALAEHVGGTEARFVAMMNGLARRLHMHNTHFVTPHGLDAPGHYSSARDLSIVARYAMRNAEFRRIVATTSYHIAATRHNKEHWLASVNRVIYWYPGVDGVKPGDTDNAGLCQVVSVRRDGKRLMAVLLNTPTLYVDIRNLLNFGLRDFRWIPSLAWWDGPDGSLSGGRGDQGWVYYFGAGHYIRGKFLSYFRTHGGLRVLGYPRTEAILDHKQLVQFFQGGELVYDPAHESVYPQPITLTHLGRISHALQRSVRLSPLLRSFYRTLGGKDVLGLPAGRPTAVEGHLVQLLEYGAIEQEGGTDVLIPVGDMELRHRGWLKGAGLGNSYPGTMSPDLLSTVALPARRSIPSGGPPRSVLSGRLHFLLQRKVRGPSGSRSASS